MAETDGAGAKFFALVTSFSEANNLSAERTDKYGYDERFVAIDDDVTGKISFRNIKRICKELGLQHTDAGYTYVRTYMHTYVRTSIHTCIHTYVRT